MSTSISQLLQITAPPSAQSAQTGDGSGDEFQSLLVQATESANPKTIEEHPESGSNDRADVSSSSEQERSTTSSNEQAPEDQVQDSTEAQAVSNEDSSEDEVELSDAATILSSSLAGEEAIIFEAAPQGEFQAEIVEVSATTAAAVEEEIVLADTTQPTTDFASLTGFGDLPSDFLQGEQVSAEVTSATEGTVVKELAAVELEQAPKVALAENATSEAQPTSETTPQAVEVQGQGPYANEHVAHAQPGVLPENAEFSGEGELGEQPQKSAPRPKPEARAEEVELGIKLEEQAPVVQATVTEQSAEGVDTSVRTETPLNAIESKSTATAETGTPEPATAPTTDTSESEPVPSQNRVRFVQRVSRAFQSARSGSNEIQLKLSPPELGTLRLSISVEQGVVSAKVETDTAAARNILLDNLPALKERLAEQDIRVEKFDVDVGRDGQQSDQQSQLDARDRQSNRQSSGSQQESATQSQSQETISEASSPVPRSTLTETGLDVSV